MEPQTQEHRDHDIKVIVFAPRSPHPKEFTWAKTLKVGEAAREAADCFRLPRGESRIADRGTASEDSR